MADKLIFPIGFDLEAAVKQAQGDAPKLLRRLQTTLNSKPLAVNLKIDKAGTGSVNEINARLKAVVRQWNSLTEAQRVTNKTTGEYTAEAKKLLAEYTRLVGASNSYARTLKQIDAEAKRAAKAQEKLASAATKGATATRKANNELKNQDGYVSRLIKRLAVYASFSYAARFLTSIREVTAEFELQRVSLGAIIQDQARANQLFAEIKSFALTSPLKILDLTKYTKQLAAYKIGVEDLFDTTKRLADISVGLGVDMQRLILFYGQVRAAGYLRASEVRQATEAGIPLVEELAKKLSKANGELVKAADVMDMISKREISFEMVAEVFQDMTDKGGMFYDMQKKQGNTLYGMWQKLGDAAAMMYDEIGNNETVNAAMKSTIEILRSLMLNWKQTGIVLGAVGAAMIAMVLQSKAAALATRMQTVEHQKYIAALRSEMIQLENNLRLRKSGNFLQRSETILTIKATQAKIAAANATNIFSRSLYNLKAAFLSNPWGWIILALTTIVGLISTTESETEKLTSKLSKIEDNYKNLNVEARKNLQELADAATKAADGSREQKEALDELSRTYGNILGNEALELENLKKLKGDYSELGDIIELYYTKRKGQERETEIKSAYTTIIKEAEKEFRNLLNAYGYSAEGQEYYIQLIRDAVRDSGDDIDLLNQKLREIKNTIRESTSNIKTFSAAFEFWNLGRAADVWGSVFKWRSTNSTVNAFTEAILHQNKALEKNRDETDKTIASLNEYSSEVASVAKSIEKLNMGETEFFGYDTSKAKTAVEKDIEAKNIGILMIWKNLQHIAQAEGVAISEEFYKGMESVAKGNRSLSFIDFDEIKKQFTSEKAKSAIAEAKKLYDTLAGRDTTNQTIYSRGLLIADKLGMELDKVTKYLIKADEAVGDYTKRLEDKIKSLKDRITEIQGTINQQMLMPENMRLNTEAIEAEMAKTQQNVVLLEMLLAMVKSLSGVSSTTRQDNRLSQLNEIEQTLTKINQKYDELLKKEGDTKALEHIQEIYGDTLKYINQLGKKFKLNFAMPTDFKTLQDYRRAILSVIETLKMKGYEKAAIELQAKIGTGDVDQLSKQIEQKLKELYDKISRTKTAREFYDKILSQTGDIELAGNLTMSIYGSEDGNIQELLAQQIQKYFGKYEVEIPVIAGTDKIDYKRVRELAKAALDAKKIGEDAYNALDKIATDGEKDLAKIAEQGAKLLLKYDEIAQQRVNIEQEASEKIRQLREAEAIFLASTASEPEKAAYKKRTDKAVAGVEADRDLKLLKLKDEYLRFFSAIHSLTSSEAEKLRTEVREALFKAFQSGAISADQLKKELKAVDEQFRKLKDDSGMAMDYLKGGFDGLIKRVRDTADELQSVAAEISKMESPDQISEGQKSFIDKILGKFGNESTGKSFADLFSKANGDTAQMAGNLQNCAEGMEGMAEGAASTLAIVDRIITDVARTIEGIAAIRDQLNEMRSEDNQLGGGFWDAFEYLENFNKYAAKGWEDLKSGNIVGAVQNTVQSIISIFGTAQAQRVRRANKEIEKQEKLLEELQYAYSRLEKAAEKAFGADYIRNYNQQLRTLQAQQAAYEKQAAAERSKGKGEDKKKTKEYENAVRDIADTIADMQGKLSEKMLGSDQASAARDFAKAWIDAYKEVGRAGAETSAKMKEKFQDMIENMVVEGALAAVMQKALQPMFDMIDNMNEQDFYNESFWKTVVAMAEKGAADADAGAQTLMKFLEQAGISIKDINTEFTGIKREVAGATSEEMNANTAALNAQNYYLSQVPGIAANVAMIAQSIVNGNTGATTATTAAGWTDWQQQAMDQYMAIQRNTADTVVECRRAAVAAENAVVQLQRVIKPSRTPATHSLHVTID